MAEQGETVEGFDTRAMLTILLKDYPVVLEKSLLPAVVAKKDRAWKEIKEAYKKNTSKDVTVGQLKKLLNNMKTHSKKKTDYNATGNMPIKLVGWEKYFLQLLNTEENPVYCKVPGAVSVGVTLDVAGSSKELENFEDGTEDFLEPTTYQPVQVVQNPSMKKKLPKKRKLSAETEETAELTTAELQRLLLLEQIKLTRLQIKREEDLLQKEQSVYGQFEQSVDGEGKKTYFSL